MPRVSPHVVDLGQQKDNMAEVRHGQGKLYRSVPSLYEATRIYKGTNIVASLAWYDHEDNDTFGTGRNGSSGASLFTFEETLIHFGSIVFCIFVTVIVVSVLTLVMVELRARLRSWHFSSRLSFAVYKFWSRLSFALRSPQIRQKLQPTMNFPKVAITVSLCQSISPSLWTGIDVMGRASSSQSQRGIRKVGKRLGTVYGGAKNVG